jgi:hypothetical protein
VRPVGEEGGVVRQNVEASDLFGEAGGGSFRRGEILEIAAEERGPSRRLETLACAPSSQ